LGQCVGRVYCANVSFALRVNSTLGSQCVSALAALDTKDEQAQEEDHQEDHHDEQQDEGAGAEGEDLQEPAG
jgi:cobalamin biosynthesis protein CobT